jgi:hypothetical protein
VNSNLDRLKIKTLNDVGRALNMQKRHAEALCALEKALSIDVADKETNRNIDETYADITQWCLVSRYKSHHGKFPRLNPPVSFNERILHRIIYDRDPQLKCFCDKLATKYYVEECLGHERVVPLLGVWQDPQEIAWCNLPHKFVIKPNHSSGDFWIVDQEKGFDLVELVSVAQKWLAQDYFDRAPEWGYRELPRVLLAEPFLCSPSGEKVPEMEVYTFHGVAKLISVSIGVKGAPDDAEYWNDRNGRRLNIKKGLPTTDVPLKREDRELAIQLAEQLSKNVSSLRVDFYLTSDGLKVGELTPYTNGSLAPWEPKGVDDLLGRLWDPDYDFSRLFEDVDAFVAK